MTITVMQSQACKAYCRKEVDVLGHVVRAICASVQGYTHLMHLLLPEDEAADTICPVKIAHNDSS